MSEKLPKGWTKLSLGEIATVKRGKFTPRPRNNPVYYGGSIPFVQTGDIANSGTYITSYSQTLNERGRKVSKVFPKNTILMTIAANIGKTSITAFDMACPDSIVGIQVDSRCADIFWLSSYLEFIRDDIDGLSTQNAQKNINLQILKPLLFNVPPLIEQQKIARILATWDAAITCTQKLLDNSKQQKKALMQQLLTGRRRLPGFNTAWAKSMIRELSKRVTRKSDGKVHPILTISSTSGFVRQDSKYRRYMAGESVNNYILLYKGEFAYNKGNSKTYEFGCIFPLNNFETGLVPHVYVCFKIHSKYCAEFYKYLFENNYLKKQLGDMVNTGVRNNGLLNIKPEEFLCATLPVPPLDEQKAIAEVLAAADALIAQYEAKLAHLQRQKKALMQQLLTGKIRVTPDTPDTSGAACETPA